MANTKISALPNYTGNTADLRWFIMNNSGETETFKYSGYTSGVRPVSGLSNSYISINYTDSDVKCIQSLLLGGNNNSIASTDATGRNTIIGGFDNTIPQGFNNTIINGYGASILGGQATIVGAAGSITDGFNNILLGGVGIVGGNNSGIVAGYGNIISPTFNDRDFIGGGTSNYITYGSDSSIIAGVSNLIEGNSNYAVICGGQSNKFTASNYGFIGGGISNIIDNSNNSSILGGSGNTISGRTNVVMVGTSGRTASASNTTYVENLRVFRQAQYGNYNNGNRATNYTIDWNNGNIQKVILTGSCVFSATNITDGTTYVFKVEQDNSGNRAATWSSGIFKFANGTPPTLSTGANDVDIFTFVAMDGLLYGVAQLNFG